MSNHTKHNNCCETNHEHNHLQNIILYILGLLIFIISLFVKDQLIKLILVILTLLMAGNHVIIGGIKDTIKSSIQNKRFMPNIHILMTIAAFGAIIIKHYDEAAILILIFAGAHLLEDYVKEKSKKEITNLINLNPKQARKLDENENVTIVNVNELNINDKVLVLNGDLVPIDGILLSNYASIDESLITGESIHKDKYEGDLVYGGTINGNDSFTMQVTKDSSDTIVSKIVSLVSKSSKTISKRATLIKKIEPIYVKIVLLLTPLFYLLGIFVFNWGNVLSFYRTMVFLIGASPCALAATDIPATLASISNLAKQKVLFKGGNYLSEFANLKVIAFDKTGTLTKGLPQVVNINFIDNMSANDIKYYKQIIVAMEKNSNHVLADAIVSSIKVKNLPDLKVENILGVGIKANIDEISYFIGKPKVFSNVSPNITKLTNSYESLGQTVIYFGTNNQVLCLISLLDVAKEDAYDAISYFNNKNIKTVMITGDSQNTGRAVANNLNIQDVYANILPEQKADIISSLQKEYGHIAMVGDGINDAIALDVANIGIAMGKGTDVAIDVADAVVMDNDISKVAYTHQVSMKLRSIVLQNMIFALSVVIFLTIMNILGLMEMTFAVIIHEGSTLVVILNGLRMLFVRNKKYKV